MIKIKFIGTSDYDFENNCVYTLINFNHIYTGFEAYITSKHQNIKCIIYRSLESFNKNWKIMEE